MSEDLEAKLKRSGRLQVHGDRLSYEGCAYCAPWDISIRDIRVIGEYTNADGPHLDDWFLAFVCDSHGWWQASNYAVGVEEAMDALRMSLGPIGKADLVESTTLRSEIVFPQGLEGQPLFKFIREPRGPGLWRAIRRKFSSELTQSISPQALEVLQARNRASA